METCAGGGGATHGADGACQGTAPSAGGGAGIGAGDGFFLGAEDGSPTAARKPPRAAGAGLVGTAAFVAASGAGAEGTVWSRN